MPFHKLTADYNGTYAFCGRQGVARCDVCGGVLDKQKDSLAGVRIRKRRDRDFSFTYDHVCVVSQRFRDVCESNGLTGTVFVQFPDDPGFYAFWSDTVVEYDWEAAGSEFLELCPRCGKYVQITTGKYTLKPGSEVPEDGFAETDLWFGFINQEVDGRGPLILCGDGAAKVLREAKLRGLEFVEEERTGVIVPSGLWSKALPRLQKLARRRSKSKTPGFLPEPIVSLRLRSGRVVDDVVVDWQGEVVTGLRCDWPEEGPDFKSEDIVAIGVPTIFFPTFWRPRRWIEL
jgi:hypothetical protein